MARPRDSFDWVLVDSLMMLEASEGFVAERLLVKEGKELNNKSLQAKIKFIQRRIKERWGLSFVQYRDKKMENRKLKLKELQWKLCDSMNPTMLIFMGKQYLGQADKLEQKTTDETDPSKKILTVKTDPSEVKAVLEKVRKDC